MLNYHPGILSKGFFIALQNISQRVRLGVVVAKLVKPQIVILDIASSNLGFMLAF